jgi:hypothetical protein
MDKNICETCNKIFKSKYNLKSHLERNKKCLGLRGEEMKKDFECTCGHLSVQNIDLLNHQKKCIQYITESIKKEFEVDFDSRKKEYEKRIEKKIEKELERKYENRIQELTFQLKESKQKLEDFHNNMISKLETKLEKCETTIQKMAENPKVTTNTITHNNNINSNNSTLQMLDLDHHIISNFLKNDLKPEDVGQGQIGFAKAVHSHLLVSGNGDPKYKCTDPSRHIYEYVNKDGDVVKDVKSTKLTNALVTCPKFDEIILKKGEEIWTGKDGKIDDDKFHFFSDKPMEITLLSSDNSKFRNTLSSITS